MATTSKNSLSLLKEYHDRCARNKTLIPEPAYDVGSSKPGEFGCTCKYRGFSTEGTGTSKTAARNEAATNMLRKLNITVPPAAAVTKIPDQRSVESTAVRTGLETSHQSTNAGSSSSEKLAKDFYDRYSNKEISLFLSYPPTPEDLSMCFGDINFGMKSPNAPRSETLYKRLDRNMNPITCFEQVMKEFGFKFFVEEAEVDPKLAGNAFVVLLKIDLCCMVIGGFGESLPKAIERACRNGLDTFLLYMN